MTEKEILSLNVFTYGIGGWKYPSNWFRNIKQFFRNIKYAWQRATRGFCDQDWWNLDIYYTTLFVKSLRHLATHNMGHPYDMDEDKWNAWLRETADEFYKSLEETNSFENPYAEEAEALFDKWTWDPTDDGMYRLNQHYTDDENELNNAYLEVERLNAQKRLWCAQRGLQRLSDRWTNLWD